MEFIGIFIIMAVLIFFGWVRPIWWMFDHWGWSTCSKPDSNAQPNDFTSERVKYVKNDAKFKTTVTFTDGFYFITHKTSRMDYFMSYTISLPPELKAEILNKAIAKHAAAVDDINKKAKKECGHP